MLRNFWDPTYKTPDPFLYPEGNPPAMPVVAGGGTEKGFSSSKCNYTKKLWCAKLNVRLATVHKGSAQEDVTISCSRRNITEK